MVENVDQQNRTNPGRQPSKVRTRVVRELNTHALLMACAEQAALRARSPAPGPERAEAAAPTRTHDAMLSFTATNDAMMSVVFSAFVVEAVANFLGTHYLKDWHAKERLPWEEKLKLLASEAGLARLSFGKRPWQSVKDAFIVRDALAHGRHYRKESPVEHPSTLTADHDRHPARYDLMKMVEWQRHCQPKGVARLLEDVRAATHQLASALGWAGDLFQSLAGSSAVTTVPISTVVEAEAVRPDGRQGKKMSKAKGSRKSRGQGAARRAGK